MTILDIMQDVVTGNLLRYAAGQQICCPGCGVVLDWRRVVLFKGRTTCVTCFAAAVNRVVDRGGIDLVEWLTNRERKADLDCARNMHVDDNGHLVIGALALTDVEN